MKSFVVAFVLCSTLFASAASAQQSRGRPVPTGVPGAPVIPVQGQLLTASLTSFSIDRREHFARANSGLVAIDIARRTVTLTLERTPICAPNQMCAQFLENVASFTLPLVARNVDSRCGSVMYTATKDMRPVDGPLVQIEITDNTRFSCPSRVRVVPTFVALRQVPARFSFNEERRSTFFATKLENTLTAIPFNGQPVFAQ